MSILMLKMWQLVVSTPVFNLWNQEIVINSIDMLFVTRLQTGWLFSLKW